MARFYDIPRSPDPPLLPFPLRVALVSSDPDGMVPLDVESERSRIEAALSGHRGIECRSFEGTARGIRAAVLGAKCHVLHFMGHADVDAITGKSFLAVERQDGSLHMLDAADFTDLVRGGSLQLVVLNACRTGDVESAREEALYGRLVPSLTLAGVRAIIAMSSSVRDTAAIGLSEGLYSALAGGDPADVALTEARLAIKNGESGSEDWPLPALYLRGRHAEIFRPEPTEANPSSEARRLFERGRLAAAEGDFARARGAFLRALTNHTRYERAEAEYCFAALAERGVSTLTRRQAEDLNRRLDRLCRSDTLEVEWLAILLLAVLRHDFFEVKRVRPSGVPSEEVYRRLCSHPPDERCQLRIASLNPSMTARLRFGLAPAGPRTERSN